MVMSIAIDDQHCERLIERSVAGDAAARCELMEYLWPIWIELVQSNRAMRRLVNREDGVHDVVAKLVEKLGHTEGRGFHSYLPWKESNSGKSFQDWLRIVTKNMIRDYLRAKVGPQSATGEPSIKRLLNEFASAPFLEALGIRPPVTLTQTARELLEFARNRLKPMQLMVLNAWLKGASFEEMADDLALTPEGARQDLRAAIAVLRRYFLSAEE
jgi:RNA polymerase sigma factor (sigma-70 family)